MGFVISILLKSALTVVKDVFRDFNCVKCKKWMVICYFSQVTHKANLKANKMNAYFQHLLFY